MIYSIYGFSNYLPVVINLVMFVIFLKFDLEEKLPKMREKSLRAEQERPLKNKKQILSRSRQS